LLISLVYFCLITTFPTRRSSDLSRFEGTTDYIATDDLKVAVNAAVTLERPLLIKGEPGTGKTVLAFELARALGAPLITWHIKSTDRKSTRLNSSHVKNSYAVFCL